MADRCGPPFSVAWRSPSVQLPDISTTNAPRCLYCRNKRLAGCFTSAKEAKYPRPRRLRTNSAHPSLWTSFVSRATYFLSEEKGAFRGGPGRSPFHSAWRSPSVQLSDMSTTGAPRCLYCRNKRHARCFTSSKEEKYPCPRCLRTNSAHPSLLTSFASRAT